MSETFRTAVETAIFARRAEKLLTASEKIDLITQLATNPEAGDLIPETGGVRKLRFGIRGKGKAGGVRVIYYYLDDEVPLFAMLIYGKGEKADLTADERKTVAQIAAAIKQTAKRRKDPPRLERET